MLVPLALAFAGGLCSMLALGLAFVCGDFFAAKCGIIMATHCAAEFILQSAAGVDFD